jgi:uncharacterized tellurite resistance protein B-like protein
MHVYSTNSPEAMSRVVAMMIVADAHIDDREIAILDTLNAFAALGISRKDFMGVARDYCGDLRRLADADGSTALIDPARTDQIIGAVTDAAKRLVVAQLLMAVVAADYQHGEGELVLFAHILDTWGLSREQVTNAT